MDGRSHSRAELAVLTLEAAYSKRRKSERDDPDNNDQDGSCLKVSRPKQRNPF